MATNKPFQSQKAAEARKAAEKARRLGNEPTAKMFDRIAAAHDGFAK